MHKKRKTFISQEDRNPIFTEKEIQRVVEEVIAGRTVAMKKKIAKVFMPTRVHSRIKYLDKKGYVTFDSFNEEDIKTISSRLSYKSTIEQIDEVICQYQTWNMSYRINK